MRPAPIEKPLPPEPAQTCAALPPPIAVTDAPAGRLVAKAAPPTSRARHAVFGHEGMRWTLVERREDDYSLRVFEDGSPVATPLFAFEHHSPFDIPLGFAAGGETIVAGGSRVDWRTGAETKDVFASLTERVSESGGRLAKVWASKLRTSAGGGRMAVLVREEFRSKRLKGEGPSDYDKTSVHLLDGRSGVEVAGDRRRVVADGPFDVSEKYLAAVSPERDALLVWRADLPDATRRSMEGVRGVGGPPSGGRREPEGRASPEGLPSVSGISIEAGDRRLATIHGSQVVMWSVPELCPVARWKTNATIEQAALVPQRDELVLVTSAGSLELWSASSPGTRLASVTLDAAVSGGAAWTNGLSISADGKRVLVLLNLDLGVRLYSIER